MTKKLNFTSFYHYFSDDPEIYWSMVADIVKFFGEEYLGDDDQDRRISIIFEPPPLPTTPGSVIECMNQRWMLLDDGEWASQDNKSYLRPKDSFTEKWTFIA